MELLVQNQGAFDEGKGAEDREGGGGGVYLSPKRLVASEAKC